MEVRERLGFWAVIVGEMGEGSWLQSKKFYRSRGDGEFDKQVPRTAGTATRYVFLKILSILRREETICD